MNDSTPRPSRLRQLAVSAIVPVVLTVIYAIQSVLTGKESWRHAFAQEATFCGTWWVLGLLIFRLCTELHREPTSRRRIVAGLSVGALLVILFDPTILIIGGNMVDWTKSLLAGRAPDLALFSKSWPGLFLNLFGFNLLIYGGIVVAWYALTSYRDLQRRRLETAEMQALLQQAELQALRNQLNPHFLFNTLHSIAELVHENPRLAEQILLRLSELLRQALHSSGAQEIALADELKFVRGYVEIEQLRLGDRLRVTWDIAPDVLDARVPSLLLQPLVENAVQHGIAPSTRGGTLVIRARRDGDWFDVQVHDDGPGLAGNGSSRGSGVGLANTSARLQRLYGARQRFELINHQGLRVNVRLPFAVTPRDSNAA